MANYCLEQETPEAHNQRHYNMRCVMFANCGSVSYMVFLVLFFQPERIDPSASRQGYDVRSDVWSLGITLVGVREERHILDSMAIK